MASPRNAYQLLHAIEQYREGEKDMPEGVDSLLGDLSSKLHDTATGKPGDGSDSSDSSFAEAKEKAREKFRANEKSEGDTPEGEKKDQ